MLALTHVPSPRMSHGLRTHIARTAIDLDLALRQHAEYCATLRACGAEVRTLDANRHLPDGTFIEDTAIVLDEVAVLTSMGNEARRAELPGIARELVKVRPLLRIEPPAAIEGGDVLRVGRTLLVGLSLRTNEQGVRALEAIVGHYGYDVIPVPVRNCLHLKTACTALPDHALLMNPEWLDTSSLGGFEKINVCADEPWAANTLTVGTTVCISAEHVHTAAMIRARGFDVGTIQLSEFAKAEGCVTCLSLLFADSSKP
jgi:dimethylargininase